MPSPSPEALCDLHARLLAANLATEAGLIEAEALVDGALDGYGPISPTSVQHIVVADLRARLFAAHQAYRRLADLCATFGADLTRAAAMLRNEGVVAVDVDRLGGSMREEIDRLRHQVPLHRAAVSGAVGEFVGALACRETEHPVLAAARRAKAASGRA